MSVHVTAHAIDRYIERIEPCARDVARDRIAAHAPAIARAAAFGCGCVRLADRTKLILQGETVVTVAQMPRCKRLRFHPEGRRR